MKRIYDSVIKQHLAKYEQMIFLSGPRQVGKTTLTEAQSDFLQNFIYLNWDNKDHRAIILKGPSYIADYFNIKKLQREKTIIVFDELHKYRSWKIFLKGFFDVYKKHVHIIVTGSAWLNIYKRGDDSLMGRYFPYRIHPLSIAECLSTYLIDQEIRPPTLVKDELFQDLFNFGGFPESFLKRDKRFSNRWQALRQEQLFQEDLRDLSHIHDIYQLEMLANLLKLQAGNLMNLNNLANKADIAAVTAKRWIQTLQAFYYCFAVKPWAKNVARSLIKTPKIYLWDWSEVDDLGMRAENFVASHLLKAVHFWTDYGFGNYDLFYLRDKEKREVDFLVTKNKKPWFLVETKYSSNHHLNKNLSVFQAQTQAQHAFQVVFNEPAVDADCFQHHQPIVVPVQTFLSQLV